MFVSFTEPSRAPLTASEFYASRTTHARTVANKSKHSSPPSCQLFLRLTSMPHVHSSLFTECISSCERSCHSFSVLSSEPVTSNYASRPRTDLTLPEGVTAADVTVPVWPLRIYVSRPCATPTVGSSLVYVIQVHTLKSLPDANSMLPYGSRPRAVRTFGWNFSHSSSSGPCNDATHLPLAVCHTLMIPFISPVAHRSPAALKAIALTLSYTSARDTGWTSCPMSSRLCSGWL